MDKQDEKESKMKRRLAGYTFSIKRAKEGSKRDARHVVEALAEELEAGTPLGEPLKSYLIGALKDIAAGDSADKAFHLKGRRGKNHEAESKNLFENDIAFEWLRRIKKLNPNIELSAACQYLSEQIEAGNVDMRYASGEALEKRYRRFILTWNFPSSF